MDTLMTFGILLLELLALFVVILTAITLLQRRLGEDRIREVLSSPRPLTGLIKGAALGAVTPFCSCSTIPIVLGLVRAGVRFGTVAAFLIASPLLNPIILAIVGVLFGWQLALGYGVVGFAATVAIAWLWERAGLERAVKRVRLAPAAEATDVGSGDDGRPRAGDAATATLEALETWQGLRNELRPALRRTFSTLRGMLVPLLVGIAIGATIYGAVPDTWLRSVLGPANPLAVPLAAVVGIPLYVRAEVALPIGLALTSAGVGLGPVFALIIGGAGASIPEVSMLTGIFRPRLVALFVVSVLAVAIAGGSLIPLFA